MNVQEQSKKAALSVVEVAALCRLSPSRFHSLVRQGVFPKAVKASEGRRPHYPHELVQRCIEIRSTGIGENGLVTLFNRPPKKNSARRTMNKSQPSVHDGLIEALQGLGLSVNAESVAMAVQKVFPNGISGVQDSEITRKVFLFLKKNTGLTGEYVSCYPT